MNRFTDQGRVEAIFSRLPGYLKSISLTVPPAHPWTDIHTIINQHTNFPYFMFFKDETTKQLTLEKYINEKQAHSVAASLGLTKSRSSAHPKSPRFCFDCIQEDQQNFGFSIYHREHQLPGVCVCWKHGSPLYNGCLKCEGLPVNGRRLSMPGECKCLDHIDPILISREPPNKPDVLLWIAQQSAYMTNKWDVTLNQTHQALRQLANERNLLDGSNHTEIYNNIFSAVENRFGVQTIDWLQIRRNTQNHSPWIRFLYRKDYALAQHSTIHTIQYLLLIGLFFDSVEDFVNYCRATTFSPSPSPKKPKKPKKPLNKTIIELCKQRSTGIPGIAQKVGIYPILLVKMLKENNVQFDLTEQKRIRIGEENIQSILKSLESGMDKKSIQSKYNCSEWTLSLIELAFPKSVELHEENKQRSRRKKFRKALKDLMTKHPGLTRSGIQEIASGIYDYLIKNDKKWFQETVPQKQVTPHPPQKRDWTTYDQSKSVEIENYLEKLKSERSKPIWITKTGLLKAVSILSKATARPENFPMVNKTIYKHVETRHHFEKRKIKWAVNEVANRGQCLSQDNLRRMANLTSKALKKHKPYIRKLAAEKSLKICSNSALAAV
jgi:hypothetical protein